MITVKTYHPIAVDSLDHKYPEGVYYDNNVSMNFVQELETLFDNKRINFLDLGCAGGALATTMYDRGHNAVGIDGSDGCLNVRQDVIEHFGNVPAGHNNWVKYNNKVLFTADVTNEYDILEDSKPMKFQAITCWDVMEHFEPDTIDTFLEQVDKHLADDGVFMASIALFSSGTGIPWEDAPNIEYHKSIFNREWWMNHLEKYFRITRFPLSVCNREYIQISLVDNTGSEYLIFAAYKK